MNDTNNSKKGGNLGQFILGKTIGEGTFGRVKIATHITTGEKVAIKILEKIKILEDSDKTRIDREIKILKSLMHKNIIQIYSVIENPTTIFLIMEYVNGGELFEYICLKQKLSELEACKFYQEIISGIEYLHKQGIVHRDLKPENLLLNAKKDLKIVDFGLSNIYGKNELLKTPCGSPCYAAPEMILGKQYNGLFVDIWSSGVILYAMVFGCLPFDDPDTDVLYKRITEGRFYLPSGASDRFKDFIRKLLTTDPSRRIGLDAIKAHPWFNLITPRIVQGIFIKKFQIPVDPIVLEEMVKMNYNKREVKELVLSNRHNHITTLYYLILKKHLRSGRTSVADLSSDEYIRFLKDPRNLIDNQSTLRLTERNKNTLETVIHNTTETVKLLNRTNETITNNIINSDGSASNNKLKDSLFKESTGNATNPDFHNIYDEQTNPNINNVNNNILTSEAHKNSEKLITQKTNSNKNFFQKQESLATENNNCVVTEAIINFTETYQQNNDLITEMNYLNTKENNNFDINNNENTFTDIEPNININNNNNNNLTINKPENNKNEVYNQTAQTEAEASVIPEYLQTDFNNEAATNCNVNLTLYQETEQNENKSLNFTYNNFDLETKVWERSHFNKVTGSYSNILCPTDNDIINNVKPSFNKSDLINENSFIENLYQNSVLNSNMFNDNENNFDFIRNELNVKKNNLKSNNFNVNASRYKVQGLDNNARNLNNNSVISKNNNLKKRIFNDQKNNYSISKSPDVKKKVIFEAKNYMSKSTNKSENKSNNLKNFNKTYNKNNLLNASYNDNNILNTESSIKKIEYTDRLNISVKLNKDLKNTKNYSATINAKTNDKKNFIRNLVKTNAERFKKGFFNTSVSYEKSANVKNRTFDGKMYETSKSKSRERNPIVSNFNNSVLKKNLGNGIKKEDVNNNKGILYKKLNTYKFQTNIAMNTNCNINNNTSSRNNSASKKEKNNNTNMTLINSSFNSELRKTDRFKKTEAFNSSLNKKSNLYNVKNTYELQNQTSKNRDRRANTSCPENSEYSKITTYKDIYTIKEDDEYKKTLNFIKLKVPTFTTSKDQTQNNSRFRNNNNNYNISIPTNQSLNNSINKAKNYIPNVSYSPGFPKPTVNANRINVKFKNTNLISNINYSNNNNNNFEDKNTLTSNKNEAINFSVTPPKFSNYANYKFSAANKTSTFKSNNNSNNNSLNNSINTNNTSVNNTPLKRNMQTPTKMLKNKNLNFSENISVGKPVKKTNYEKAKIPNSTRKENNNAFKIPIDKNSYKEKYKNININFYQNIIINENNNKRKASGNSETTKKDIDVKVK